MAVLACPKPIPKVNLVLRPKHNTAFVEFTRVNNQGKQSLPSKSSDSQTGDSSDEEIPANYLLEFTSDSEEDDEEIEQDPGCSSFYSENTAFPTSGCNKSKVIRRWKKEMSKPKF
ncbi:hypothetical protein TNCV_2312351 [Trichonephila clavipes]|nr:hypothetical protein TNCV_2312351 [Trichonephila clavipes]